jgi:hypothetical protein
MMNAHFNILLGETIASISGLEPGSEEVTVTLASGAKFRLYHSQDCCENVLVEDVIGDPADLLNSPVLLAEEASQSNENPAGVVKEYQDSFTWTFYKLATLKGYVTIRWYGESNGYYSESVDFIAL